MGNLQFNGEQMLLGVAVCGPLSCFAVQAEQALHLFLLSRKKEISPQDSKGGNTRSRT